MCLITETSHYYIISFSNVVVLPFIVFYMLLYVCPVLYIPAGSLSYPNVNKSISTRAISNVNQLIVEHQML